MKTKILKAVVGLACAMAMLAVTSCRSQYYFPGGFKNRRIPAKGCGCPSYSWASPINVYDGENCELTCFFENCNLHHAVDAGGLSGSEVLR